MNPLSIRIAVRYLASKKSHTAVSIISVISICAVAVTVLAMVCVMSVFNGFQELVGSKLSKLEPDVRITAAKGSAIGNADSLLQIIKKTDGVQEAVPTITENALAIYGNRQIPVTLKGIPDNYGRITALPAFVKPDGSFAVSRDGYDYCILSIGAAIALDASPESGEVCNIYAPKRIGAVNIANPASAFRKISVPVSGVFEIKQGEFDQNYAYTSLAAARRLFGFGEEATAIEISLTDDAAETAVMETLQKELGDGYRVENRLMQHRQSLKLINVEKWIAFLLLSLILVIASFNVISTLSILILEKGGSISTLHALGADNRTVGNIFAAEGWLITTAGAAAGIVLGVALCLLQQHFGFIRLSADTQNLIIDTYPVAVKAADVCAIFAIVTAVGLAASLATVRAMRGYIRR